MTAAQLKRQGRALVVVVVLALVFIGGAVIAQPVQSAQAQQELTAQLAAMGNQVKATQVLLVKLEAMGMGAQAQSLVEGVDTQSQVEGWAWPAPGGPLAPGFTVQRPDGSWESWPERCVVFEDGSARCGAWDQ